MKAELRDRFIWAPGFSNVSPLGLFLFQEPIDFSIQWNQLPWAFWHQTPKCAHWYNSGRFVNSNSLQLIWFLFSWCWSRQNVWFCSHSPWSAGMNGYVASAGWTSTRHFRIDVAEDGFLTSIQSWFFPPASPIVTDGICIHLVAQVSPGSTYQGLFFIYFSLFSCFTCNSQANPCQCTFKATSQTVFLKVILISCLQFCKSFAVPFLLHWYRGSLQDQP